MVGKKEQAEVGREREERLIEGACAWRAGERLYQVGRSVGPALLSLVLSETASRDISVVA